MTTIGPESGRGMKEVQKILRRLYFSNTVLSLGSKVNPRTLVALVAIPELVVAQMHTETQDISIGDQQHLENQRGGQRGQSISCLARLARLPPSRVSLPQDQRKWQGTGLACVRV